MEEDQGQTVLDDILIAGGFGEAANYKKDNGPALIPSRAAVDKATASSSASDSEEDDVFEALRRKRIMEMKRGADQAVVKTSILSVSPEEFGRVITMSFDQICVLLIHGPSNSIDLFKKHCFKVCSDHRMQLCTMLYSSMISQIRESDLPVVMVYSKGHVLAQFTTLKEFGGRHLTPQSMLNLSDVTQCVSNRMAIRTAPHPCYIS